MDFLDSCRICRTHCTTSNSQYITTSINDIEIREILTQTIPIDFNDEISQKLPQKICFACFETFMSAYELQKIAIKSDEIFREKFESEEHPSEAKNEGLDEFKLECDEVVDFDVLDVSQKPQTGKKSRKQNLEVKQDDNMAVKFCKIVHSDSIGSFDKISTGSHTNSIKELSESNSINESSDIEEILDSDDEVELPQPNRTRMMKENSNKIKIVKSSGVFHPRKFFDTDNSSSDQDLYVCNFCNAKHPLRNIFMHMQRHNPRMYPFPCKLCNKRFKDNERLEHHLRFGCVARMKIFKCSRCDVTGTSKVGMENHIIDDHMGGLTKIETLKECEMCVERFENQTLLEEHLMIVHERLFRKLTSDEVKFTLKCCQCEKIFNNQESFKTHTQNHKENFLPFKCKFHGREIITFKSLEVHLKMVNQLQTHKCLTCNENFIYGFKFIEHIREHLQKKEATIKCSECEMTFNSRSDFKEHFNAKHKEDVEKTKMRNAMADMGTFICQYCGKTMRSNDYLKKHIQRIHNKDTAKKFPCKLCPKVFLSTTALKNHGIVHSTERPYICDICGFATKHGDRLKRHIQRHAGIVKKNYVCSFCGKAFDQKGSLDSHVNTHTGNKPHTCKYCDRAYAHYGDLMKHLKKVHFNDLMYKCEKCSKAFRTLVELREHLGEHENDV